MRYRVSFSGDDLKSLIVNENEYKGLIKVLNNSKFVQIKGRIIATYAIKCIEPIKEEPLYLPPADPKPIPKSFLKKLKEDFVKRFSWESK